MRTVKVLTTATVALTGCLGNGDDEGEGARHSGFFFVRREALACGGEHATETVCARYTVAPVNGGLARCAGDRVSSSCAVSNLDLAAVGLSPSQERILRAGISSSLGAPTVVLRGTIDGERFTATEAWRAPVERVVFGTVVEIVGAGERFVQHRINTATEPTYVSAVDMSAVGGMSPTLRAKALSDAASAEGIVVAGTTSYDAAGRRIVRAEQVFVRAAAFDAP
jgi:hypothetical protein